MTLQVDARRREVKEEKRMCITTSLPQFHGHIVRGTVISTNDQSEFLASLS